MLTGRVPATSRATVVAVAEAVIALTAATPDAGAGLP